MRLKQVLRLFTAKYRLSFDQQNLWHCGRGGHGCQQVSKFISTWLIPDCASAELARTSIRQTQAHALGVIERKRETERETEREREKETERERESGSPSYMVQTKAQATIHAKPCTKSRVKCNLHPFASRRPQEWLFESGNSQPNGPKRFSRLQPQTHVLATLRGKDFELQIYKTTDTNLGILGYIRQKGSHRLVSAFLGS